MVLKWYKILQSFTNSFSDMSKCNSQEVIWIYNFYYFYDTVSLYSCSPQIRIGIAFCAPLCSSKFRWATRQNYIRPFIKYMVHITFFLKLPSISNMATFLSDLIWQQVYSNCSKWHKFVAIKTIFDTCCHCLIKRVMLTDLLI